MSKTDETMNKIIDIWSQTDAILEERLGPPAPDAKIGGPAVWRWKPLMPRSLRDGATYDIDIAWWPDNPTTAVFKDGTFRPAGFENDPDRWMPPQFVTVNHEIMPRSPDAAVDHQSPRCPSLPGSR